MADDTAVILLECVDAVTGVKITKISEIVQDQHFEKFFTKLHENLEPPVSFKKSSVLIQSSFKEQFINPNLVELSQARRGDEKELTKLVLLLLYTAFLTKEDIRTLLSNSLNHQLQLKLKYLFECIHLEGSCLSVKYLNILISENWELRCSSANQGSGSSNSAGSRPWMSSSPVVYTSSPKAASYQSPLRELLQSPTFRIQHKLDSSVKEIKRLNKELVDLENEKAEWLVEKQKNLKRNAKLEQELQTLREQQMTLRRDRDNLESRVTVCEDQNNTQAHKLGRELALARSENSTLQHTLKEVTGKNDELSTKEDAIHSRLMLLLKEHKKLVEVQEQHHVTTRLLDERDQLLNQYAERIHNLEQQLQESRPRSRPHNFTIESLDASHAQALSSPTGRENMGTAVVDLMLQETQQQLQDLQQQHAALQHKLQEAQQHSEQVAKKVQAHTEETERLRQKLLLVEASFIDKEKECTNAKEEVMRVERVAENDVRRLKEKMVGLKQKYKDDKQGYADKMFRQKTDFKDHITKLKEEIEKYKTISDDCKPVEQKYEAAKHKLAQAYANLSDTTTAKNDYYRQITKDKEHVSRLRESVQQKKQHGLAAEASPAMKKLQADKQALEARLATVDSKIRELVRNWNRESLGAPGNGSAIRGTVSGSSLTSSGAAGTRAGRSSVAGQRGAENRQIVAASRRDGSTSRPSAAAATSGRAGGTTCTASYRKAVGRASTVRGPSSSSSVEDNLLDSSDVPLLPVPSASTGPEKAKSSDGLFRKPSIRITATEDRTRSKTPVELRALVSNLDEEVGEEGDEELFWEEGEKRLREDKKKKPREGERKKKMAMLKDQHARRMTVDDRIIQDEISGKSSATPAEGNNRRSMTRSVTRGLRKFSISEEDDVVINPDREKSLLLTLRSTKTKQQQINASPKASPGPKVKKGKKRKKGKCPKRFGEDKIEKWCNGCRNKKTCLLF